MSVEPSAGDDFLDEGLRVMRDSAVPLRDAQALAGRRDRILPHLSARLARRRRFVRRAAATAGVLAAAAASALAVWLSRSEVQAPAARLASAGDVRVRAAQDEPWESAQASGSVPWGAAVKTASGAVARLVTDHGARLELTDAGELAFDQAGQHVFLHEGLLRLELSTDTDWAIRTSHTELKAHGALFSVTVREEAAMPCVVVERGEVELLADARVQILSAGDEAGCSLPKNELSPALEPRAVPLPLPDSPPPAPAVPDPTPNTPRQVSALSAQNRLFQRALSLEREGELDSALAQLELLIERHPSSPLVEQARLQRRAIMSRLEEKKP